MTEYGYRYVIRKDLYDLPDALAYHERDARRRLVEMLEPGDAWFRLYPRHDTPMKWVPWGSMDEPGGDSLGQGLVECRWEQADHVWMRWTLVARDD